MELRHGWLSNGRQESVAEHAWLPVEHEKTFMLGKHTDFDPVLSA